MNKQGLEKHFEHHIKTDRSSHIGHILFWNQSKTFPWHQIDINEKHMAAHRVTSNTTDHTHPGIEQ